MTNEQLTEAIEAATPVVRECVGGWIAISTKQAEVLRSAAQQLLDQRRRLERLGPERLAEMREFSAGVHDVYRCLAMVRDLLYVIGGDAS